VSSALRALACALLILAPLAATAEGAQTECDAAEVVGERPPLAADVRDPVFATLLGLLNENRYGCVSAQALGQEVRRTGRRTLLPYQRLKRLVRRPAPGGGNALVTIEFEDRLRVPVPYRILFFYRPGHVWSEALLEATEWRLGAIEPSGGGSPAAVADVCLFALTSGRAGVDIDGWLDRLLGGRLDDMSVDGFATFTYNQGTWGLALGKSPSGARRSGLFDFTGDRIAYPAPPALKSVVRALRTRLEALPARGQRSGG
jgi:hypothetical protein